MDQEERALEKCNLCTRPYTRVDKASGMPAISQCLWKALSRSSTVCLQPSNTESGNVISQITNRKFKSQSLDCIYKIAVLAIMNQEGNKTDSYISSVFFFSQVREDIGEQETIGHIHENFHCTYSYFSPQSQFCQNGSELPFPCHCRLYHYCQLLCSTFVEPTAFPFSLLTTPLVFSAV